MAGAGSNNELTILDYLNEDCWRAVLDYVPVQDIMRSEHTCRRWQEVVLVYLQSVHFSIKHPGFSDREAHRNCNVRTLLLRSTNYPSFECWTKKLGPSVVTVYCDSEDSLKIIDNCPNLKVVTVYVHHARNVELIKLTENTLLKASQKENLNHLQRVIFKCCPVSDHCISRFLANNALQQLEIKNNDRMTGQCLMNIKSENLKSLVLKKCYALETPHLLSAAEHLSELTKLLLLDAPRAVYNNMHLVLDKMPKLECLYNIVRYDVTKRGASRGSLFTRVSRLGRLKYLYLNTDIVTDQDLELVTQHCQELRVLWLERCNGALGVTSRGVAAVCRNAGERLIALCLWYCEYLTDIDVALIVRSCPNLKSLDLYGCLQLSEGLLPRAAAARRRLRVRDALRLRTSDIYPQDDTDEDYAQKLKQRYPELDLYYHEFKDHKDYDMFWSPE